MSLVIRCCPWLPLLGLPLLAVAGGCHESETSVRVRVTYDENWALERFRLKAQDREEPAPVARELTLLVPEEWDGQEVSIQLWGMRSDVSVAYGGVAAVPRRAAEVIVELVMVPVTCGAWCTAGETRCVGDGVATCEEGMDGCLAWSAPVSCSTEAPFCSLGECRSDCVDECSDGGARCDGPDGVLTCGDGDSDTCLDWLPATPCPSGETCTSGECRSGCEDECALGETTCEGDRVVSCGDRNADDCLEWGPPVPCDSGASCQGGSCSEGCVGDDTCTSPPAAFCFDDETLRTFDANGTCGDRTCEYGYTDMSCPLGCSGGACAEAKTAVAIDAGGNHSCALTDEGEVICWGADGLGEATPPGGTFRSVSAGRAHTCGIRTDDTVACWGGRSEDGQASPPGGQFNSVGTGWFQTCGQATVDGNVICWGQPDFGAINPGQVLSGITCGNQGHNCGLTASNAIYCWGDDANGQVTDMPSSDETFTQVDAGFSHVCAIRTDKTLRCWGYNLWGQASPPSGTFLAVSAGYNHTCGIRTDGTLACWGIPGDVGQSTPPDGTFTAIGAGDNHSCAVRTDGAVLCWGRDDDSQSTPPAVLSVQSR